MTLSANALRDYQLGDNEDYPVVASDIIYQGAAVGENGSGYARPLQAGDAFLGFALDYVDNSSGSAGDRTITVRTRGKVRLTVAGSTAITDNDRPIVYASDDGTFTTTAGSNTPIGRVHRWIASTDAVVEFDALYSAERAAVVAALATKADA
jgi:hypothetical protein